MDLCATPENAKTDVFVSPLPTADLQDCLTLGWARWTRLYAFPPPSLLQRFVPRLEQLSRRQSLILVFPWWETKSWFTDLRPLWERSRRIPMRLNLRREDLSQRVQGAVVLHPNPRILDLHAVLISGDCWERRAGQDPH